MASHDSSAPPPPGTVSTSCLVRTVTGMMEADPGLEAVKFDRAARKLSVATLGRRDAAAAERSLSERLEAAQASTSGEGCELLRGSPDCSGCTLVGAAPGSAPAGFTVTHEGGTTTIARVTCPTAPSFWRWRDLPWPRFAPRQLEIEEDGAHEHEWKWQLAAAGLCGACALGASLAGGRVGFALHLASYIAGSWFTVQEIAERLRQRVLDVHFLMLAVALGSAAIGAWGEGATLLFLFSFSGGLEHYAMGRTRREIRSLFKTAPKSATVLDPGGGERSIPVEELAPGLRLLVRPGEQFPTDAEIVRGTTAADESNLTGEAAPVEKTVGDTALAGTINLWGSIEVLVLRRPRDSALQKIIRLIREAQHLKAPSQTFTDRFGTGYTYFVLGLSAAAFLGWWALGHRPAFVSTPEVRSAFYLAMTLLVVASPCALVLSIPSAILAAIAWAARRGILFRGGAAVEQLAGVHVVAMDKTGTLTTGELKVDRVESFPPGQEDEIGIMAASLERHSNHPLARAITRHGKQQAWRTFEPEAFESVTGLGLRGRHAGRTLRLGRFEFVAGTGAGATSSLPANDAPGVSEVWVTDGTITGRILLRDDVRPEARALVGELRQEGLHPVVLTGDRPATARHLQDQLAIADVRAALKPEDKVAILREFSRQGRQVAMIGDGVNDAPSLAVADVGVAMGARGADAALEQAQVVLMHDRLENFIIAFRLSRRARRIIRQNLAIALGTVVVLMAFALAGGIPLTLGVLGHEGSTVLVVLNSLRLLIGRSAASRAPSSPAINAH